MQPVVFFAPTYAIAIYDAPADLLLQYDIRLWLRNDGFDDGDRRENHKGTTDT